MSTIDAAESAMQDYLTSVKEDVMTGVSYMIPFVTIGGILLALGYAVSTLGVGVENVFAEESAGNVSWFLAQMGLAGLAIMVPVLGGYIAYAIADRPGLAPGFLLSYLIQQGGVMQAAGETIGLNAGNAEAGYLGALVVGLVAGYVARWFKNLDVPDVVRPMMPILIVPVGTTIVLLPVVLFVIGVPVSIANAALTGYLEGLQGGQALLVGAILGGMMAVDMGGPVNKVAYVFAVGLISQQIYEPMAAVMIGGMVPPLGMAVSNFVAPHKYPDEMYEQAKSAVPLGLSFITEGAIPYGAADPLRVVPSLVLGSAVAGATTMALDVTMPAPHGGIFVVPLSNEPFLFLGALLLGTLVSAVAVTLAKPDHVEETDESVSAAQSTD